MGKLDDLKAAKNRSDLAQLLGYRTKFLAYILFHSSDTYREEKIPKKDGGERIIMVPPPRLKKLQQHLANLLQDCFEEAYGRETYGRPLSHGFRRKQSIATNAANHRNRRYVFNIDLKDFFPSINFGRVRGYFINNSFFKLEPDVATAIAQIACNNNQLPQGSPVSPVISNFIGQILDVRLVKLAKKAGCAYSRYADDITFSTREKQFSERIASINNAGAWEPSDQLHRIINRSGFEINDRKINMQYQTNRQTVTGLVVNRKVNIRAAYYRQARAMCDALFRTGDFYIGSEMRWGKPKSSETPLKGSINQLRGILDFIYLIKSKHDKRQTTIQWTDPSAISTLMKRFMEFTKFHALGAPLLITEGKTDIVYLKCAIRSLASDYPSLIDTTGPEKQILLDFFNPSQRNLDILQLPSGSEGIKNIIIKYEKLTDRFLCDGQKFPVILIVDNDSGLAAIKGVVSNQYKQSADGTSDYYYLGKNLYLIVLPLIPDTTKTEIECFFEQSVLDTEIDGRKFCRENSFDDTSKFYGKHIFAQKVVRPNSGTIDFSRFSVIFDRITKAIQDYESKLTTP